MLAMGATTYAEVPALDALTPQTIRHDGGLYLTVEGTTTALETLYGNEAQKFLFIPVEGEANTYNVKACNGMYLATDGQWTLIFSADATAKNAQVILEQSSEPEYLLLRFASTSKCLGTDSSDPGSSSYTDKDDSQNRRWKIAAYTETPVYKQLAAQDFESDNFVQKADYCEIADGGIKKPLLSSMPGWTFTGADPYNGTVYVEEVTPSQDDETIYYNLQRLRVYNPGRGLYIMRKGGRSVKVIR